MSSCDESEGEEFPTVLKGNCQPPSASHTSTLISKDPCLYECDCGLNFSRISDAQYHVNQTVEEPDYDKLLEGSVKLAIKYVKKFPDWYLECHDDKYRTRVIEICRCIFPNLRPWAFRKWFCVNVTTGLGGCICCYTRDCRTKPGTGQGQRDKAKQLRMNVAGLQYVSTMSHEIIKQHEKNFLAFFPEERTQNEFDSEEEEYSTTRAPFMEKGLLWEDFDPKQLNSPEEMPFAHTYQYDPYSGSYLCTCKLSFENINEAKKHILDANEKPSIKAFLKSKTPRESLKYSCRFPNWYISAEKLEVRQRIHDIIEEFQTKAKRLPIMQHSWACYNLYHQVFGCQKCYNNCKNNSRCFGNITKRLASIEKARGNTFKLHCDTTTHQRLHYAEKLESSDESDAEDPNFLPHQPIILANIAPESSYHECVYTTQQDYVCECGKRFNKYKNALKHVQNNINFSLTDVLKLNCLNAQKEMKKYAEMYLNMGFDEQATDMCYLIKKFKYRQNYERFWWASINFSKRLVGCSICWEFHKCATKCPIINKSLSLNSCSVPSLNQHEKSAVHQGILTSLKFRKRRIEKKIEIHKRKKRRLCSGYQSGVCVDCGWFTDLEINITENQPCKLSVTNIIKKTADDLLMSHLKENCGSKLRNFEVMQQIRQFQSDKTLKEMKHLFSGRDSLFWTCIEQEKDLPIFKSPTKPAFHFNSDEQDVSMYMEMLSSLSPDSSDSEILPSRKTRKNKIEAPVVARNIFANEDRKSVSRSRSLGRGIGDTKIPQALLRSRSRSPIVTRSGRRKDGLKNDEPIMTKSEGVPFMSKRRTTIESGTKRESFAMSPARYMDEEKQTSETEMSSPETNILEMPSVNRVDANYIPDERWITKAALHIALQSKWGYKNVWCKENVQNKLKVMGQDNVTETSIWAQRLVLQYLNGHSDKEVWKTLREQSIMQARKWMNCAKGLKQWMYTDISVLWITEDKWNQGHIFDIRTDELKIQYLVDDYSESLHVDSKLQIRFEKTEPQKWWKNLSIDVKWSGENEWYEAVIEDVLNEKKLKVRYPADNTIEEIEFGSKRLFYFAIDREIKIYGKTIELFEKLFQIAAPLAITDQPSTVSNTIHQSSTNISSSASNLNMSLPSPGHSTNSTTSSPPIQPISPLSINSTTTHIHQSQHSSYFTDNNPSSTSPSTITNNYYQPKDNNKFPVGDSGNGPFSFGLSSSGVQDNDFMEQSSRKRRMRDQMDEDFDIKEEVAYLDSFPPPRKKSKKSYTLSHEARMRQHFMSDKTEQLKYELKHYLPRRQLMKMQREYYSQGIILEEKDRYNKNGKIYSACKITCLPCKTLNEDNVYFAQGLMTIKNSALSLKNHCFPTPSVKFRKHIKNLNYWIEQGRPGLLESTSIIGGVKPKVAMTTSAPHNPRNSFETDHY